MSCNKRKNHSFFSLVYKKKIYKHSKMFSALSIADLECVWNFPQEKIVAYVLDCASEKEAKEILDLSNRNIVFKDLVSSIEEIVGMHSITTMAEFKLFEDKYYKSNLLLEKNKFV